MEKSLDAHMEEIMTEHGVVGVLCADQQGLALAANHYRIPFILLSKAKLTEKFHFLKGHDKLKVKGTANAVNAGLVCNLVEDAQNLYPDLEPQPVICLESDACNLLIKSHDNVTVAIHKVPS